MMGCVGGGKAYWIWGSTVRKRHEEARTDGGACPGRGSGGCRTGSSGDPGSFGALPSLGHLLVRLVRRASFQAARWRREEETAVSMKGRTQHLHTPLLLTHGPGLRRMASPGLIWGAHMLSPKSGISFQSAGEWTQEDRAGLGLGEAASAGRAAQRFQGSGRSR